MSSPGRRSVRAVHLPLLVGWGAGCAAACHPAPASRDVQSAPAWRTAACDTPPATFRRTTRALSPAGRDSLLRDVQARRAAWRARHVADYRLRVAETCFCPGSPPAVLEVRNGNPVAALDTAGRSASQLLARWSAYTVEGLFDVIERTSELQSQSNLVCRLLLEKKNNNDRL